jgi:hypothetical protein
MRRTGRQKALLRYIAMKRIFASCVLSIMVSFPCFAEEILFQDNFKDGLSKKWEVVGLEKTDYRIKDGGLEMRVQSKGNERGMVKVTLPFKTSDTVIASVNVTLLDDFTADKEYAALAKLTDGSVEFLAKKQRVDGKLVFAPGQYLFKGKKGEEGDVAKYEVKYTAATPEAGDLRIIVRGHYAFFQVGPSTKMSYANFFHSAIQENSKSNGFCLTAFGAPEKANHWVRFTDFKVVK